MPDAPADPAERPVARRTGTPSGFRSSGARRTPRISRNQLGIGLGIAVAVASFQMAFASNWGGWIALFPFGLLSVLRMSSTRRAFYAGWTLGFALYGPPLGFFWTLFGPAAIALWAVLAFWLGFFLALSRALAQRLAPGWMIPLIPCLWMGVEYFRSELYPLRFSWLSPGLALSPGPSMGLLPLLGTYGTGALLFLAAAVFWFGRDRTRVLGPIVAAAALLLNSTLPPRSLPPARALAVAGAQIESLGESEIPETLDRLLRHRPDAELLVLPEYSLDGPPGPGILEWCRSNRRHLVVGGRDPRPNGEFWNTAWVVDTNGSVVFHQAKSVPIQFFRDGLPATTQSLWDSPWGPIGIAVCYDLSYTRVIDRLIRQGAEALVIPTMDSLAWGPRQHRLHSRIAPARAAEYGIPIIRCASSGISQIVDARGCVTADAPTDEAVRFFSGSVFLAGPGSLPPDRWLAPLAAAISGAALIWAGFRTPIRLRGRLAASPHLQAPTS